VADKEALKKSNIELQELLSESREALQVLQEEAGERLASSPEGGVVALSKCSSDFLIIHRRSDAISYAFSKIQGHSQTSRLVDGVWNGTRASFSYLSCLLIA
jgi:hypothetical protein